MRHKTTLHLRATSSLAGAILLSLAAPFAHAQNYPNKVVRLIVPFPAGGPIDLIGRILAQKLTEDLGQQVIVDDRGGANGIIGVQLAAKAAADGYTLLMASTGTHSINPLMHRKLPYDAFADFAPIAMVSTRPYVLVVHPSLPVNTVKDLIALAKSRPGQLTYASGGGIGSPNHLAGELFKSSAGIDILHVPYTGGGPALTGTLAGEVAIFFAPIPIALPHIESGKLRMLAITGATRASVLPKLPTMAEAGLPGFEFSIWDGVVAPAHTPKDVVTRLNASLVKILKVPDIRQRFSAMGAQARSSTPDELTALMKAELTKWEKILRASGAQPE